MIWRALDTMPALRISGHLPLCLIHVHWPHGFRDEAGYPPDPRNKDDNGVKVGNGPERIDKDAKEAETRPVETVTQTDAPRTPRNRASKRKFDEKKKDKDANEKKIRKTRSRRKMMTQQNSGHWLSLCETKGS